jgi:hypothetical protein
MLWHLADQALGKPLLAHARLVTANQQDRRPSRIECERDALHLILGVGAKFFHVGMPGAVECIRVRPSQPRTQHPQESDLGDDFNLPILVEAGEPGVELLGRRDRPHPGEYKLRL